MYQQTSALSGFSRLDVRILGTLRERNTVIAFSSAAGQTTEESVDLEIDREDVERSLRSISHASDSYAKRSYGLDTLDPIRDVGGRLYARLFEGRRQITYQRALSIAESMNKGLIIHLQIEDPLIAALPWEFMHNGDDFCNLSPLTPIVRHHLGSEFPQSDPAEELHVLVATADITGTMDTAGEISRLRKLTAKFPESRLTVLEEVTPHRLLDALETEPVHVFHFAGTGVNSPNETQVLALRGEYGRDYSLLSTELLAKVLANNSALRMVYLSGCDTELVASELQRAAPAVVGIRGGITVEACLNFVRGFYAALLAGNPLAMAMTAGRQAIDLDQPGSRGWGLPELFADYPELPLVEAGAGMSKNPQPAYRSTSSSVDIPPENPEVQRQWKALQMRLAILQQNLEATETQLSRSIDDSSRSRLQSQIERLTEDIDGIDQQLAQL